MAYDSFKDELRFELGLPMNFDIPRITPLPRLTMIIQKPRSNNSVIEDFFKLEEGFKVIYSDYGDDDQTIKIIEEHAQRDYARLTNKPK